MNCVRPAEGPGLSCGVRGGGRLRHAALRHRGRRAGRRLAQQHQRAAGPFGFPFARSPFPVSEVSRENAWVARALRVPCACSCVRVVQHRAVVILDCLAQSGISLTSRDVNTTRPWRGVRTSTCSAVGWTTAPASRTLWRWRGPWRCHPCRRWACGGQSRLDKRRQSSASQLPARACLSRATHGYAAASRAWCSSACPYHGL